MNNEGKKFLHDILLSIVFIEEQVGEIKIYANYKSNEMLKSAVERKIEIIGEALNRVVKIIPDIPITNKEKIIGTRNRIIHAYDSVDDIMMWEIVIKHLPILRKEVEKLLND